jgi:hypothetical protein
MQVGNIEPLRSCALKRMLKNTVAIILGTSQQSRSRL